MHLGIVAKRGSSRAAAIADQIRTTVDVQVSIDETTASVLGCDGVEIEDLDCCDLVVSIGGDGTFLSVAHAVSPTPILGVNLGEVGFLIAVSPEDALSAVESEIEAFRSGAAEYVELPRITATATDVSLPPAINEVAIVGPRRGRGGGIDVETRIDGQLYAGTHGDGILVATPTGSTAYNLSEGGPLVHPGVSGLVVTEMCTDDSMPPLVVPPSAKTTIRIDGADAAFVVADGKKRAAVEPPETLTLRQAGKPVRIAGPRLDFFTALGKLD
ncbi:MAG: NAD(+)/NADH kinase [Natronomonas sp.]